MKKCLILLTMVSMLLLSCTEKQPEAVVVEPQPLPFAFSDILIRVDSLMQSRPDSALMVLLSRRDSETSSLIDDNYRQLLLSEALYKTDNPQYYRAELQSAMHCFDSLAAQYPSNSDLAMLSARSHYMNGVGFYEIDSVVGACREYMRTLEIMEGHFDVGMLTGYRAKFMGLTYNRLVDLYSEQLMMEQTIYCCRQALHYCNIEPTSKYGTANLLSCIGTQYHELGCIDSASYYYKEALKVLPDYDNIRYRSVVASLKLVDYQKGGSAENALYTLKKLVKEADDYEEQLFRFLTIGHILYEVKIYDSAVVYLEKVYNDNNDLLSKIQAAEYLRNIYIYYGDTVKTNKYSSILADNTIKLYNNKAMAAVLNDIYQQHIVNTENNKPRESEKFSERSTTHIVIPLVLIVSMVAITYKMSRNRIARHKEELDKTKDSLSEIKMKINVRHFVDEPICHFILNVVKEQQFKSKIDYNFYKKYALGKNQLVELREAVNMHYDKFTIKLKNNYPKLTNDDIDYCCLYLLGLKETDVFALMQKDFSTVCYRSRKIKNILKTDKSLTEALYNLTSLQP